MRDAPSIAPFLRRLRHRVASLFRGRRLDAEMTEEMRFHMELQAEEHVREGMDPAEAAEQARREFGHVDGFSETCRDERGFVWISQLGQDLRYGLRMLRRTPGFTAAAVLTLALGIGVNTAIFSLTDEILLRQLPVRDPSGLVLFHWASAKGLSVGTMGSFESDPATHQMSCTSFSLPAFERFSRSDRDLAGIFAFSAISRMTVVSDGDAQAVQLGELISGGGFSVLGVAAAEGRVIGDADDKPGAPPVAVISYGYWRRRFGSDPAVVGKSVLVNRLPVTIVGVAPEAFSGTLQVGDSPDLYLPISLAGGLGFIGPEDLANPAKFWWVQMMGRARPGSSRAQIRAALEGILQQCATESLVAVGAPVPADRAELPTLIVGPGGQGLSEIRHRYAQEWGILSALGATVLAIACANIASLLLARGASRQREVGVRLAMGAGRGRIVRQLLTESAMLSGFGGALAVPVALWVEDALVVLQPRMEGHSLAITPHPDPRVFAIAALFSLLTGFLFGILPALRATRVSISAEFLGGTHNRPGGTRSALGKALIVIQVALSLVLLVGAGLFARTLQNLHNVDIGFDKERLLLFQLNPNPTGVGFDAADAENRRVAEALRSLPGAVSVTYSKMPLLDEMGWNTRISVPGGPPSPEGGARNAMVNAVGADFFPTYGIPIVRGRGIVGTDGASPRTVAVINQAMGKAFFGDEDPVGRVIEQVNFQGKPTPVEVVGIARDAMYSEVRQSAPPTLYFPFHVSKQQRSAEATFAVRTSGDPGMMVSLVRSAVRSVDPMLPMDDVRTQETQIADLSANERMFALLSGLFSLLAVGLVSLGLYGLISYSVLRRTAEIGLRMALGAEASSVLWTVLRESLAVVAIGVLLGLAGAFVATRIVANMLFGLTATDPATFLASALLLLGVGFIAGWMPARRASRVDPMVALRCD